MHVQSMFSLYGFPDLCMFIKALDRIRYFVAIDNGINIDVVMGINRLTRFIKVLERHLTLNISHFHYFYIDLNVMY